jgi:hypothetical protein
VSNPLDSRNLYRSILLMRTGSYSTMSPAVSTLSLKVVVDVAGVVRLAAPRTP